MDKTKNLLDLNEFNSGILEDLGEYDDDSYELLDEEELEYILSVYERE